MGYHSRIGWVNTVRIEWNKSVVFKAYFSLFKFGNIQVFDTRYLPGDVHFFSHRLFVYVRPALEIWGRIHLWPGPISAYSASGLCEGSGIRTRMVPPLS